MVSMPMTGNAELDLAMMMNMRRQGAMGMANVEVQQGKDPKRRSMVKSIRSTRKKAHQAHC